jgi:hypothetical protein
MAADEYFDAIGQVLSYVLSAEDFVHSQRYNDSGTQFWIKRDGTILDFYAQPNNRYFVIVYQFSLSQTISEAYEQDSQLLQEHMEQFEFDDTSISDENLYQNIALHRIRDVEDEEAQKVVTDIRALTTHTDCRIGSLTGQLPEEPETEVWDGVTVSGLLYPYESNFSPRDYEQTAQEVISVGNQIDEAMKKLNIMNEIGFSP